MTDRSLIKAELQNLQKSLEAKADMCIGAGKMKVLSFANACSGALELLKEQEPIKPTVAIDTWICSKCGHTLESQELIDYKENPQVLVREIYNFCPNCGKAVKWDESKNT